MVDIGRTEGEGRKGNEEGKQGRKKTKEGRNWWILEGRKEGKQGRETRKEENVRRKRLVDVGRTETRKEGWETRKEKNYRKGHKEGKQRKKKMKGGRGLVDIGKTE